MKTLKITGLLMITLLTFGSCKKNKGIKGNGKVKTESRTVEDFEKIDLSGCATVYLTQGEIFDLKVETDENILPFVTTEVRGNELEIGFKDNTYIRDNSKLFVYITMPRVNEVAISGSGDIIGNGEFNTNTFVADISGSGDIDFAQLNSESVTIDISGSGDIELASRDTIKSGTINVSGSGDIKLYSMPVLSAKTNISGSGDINLKVINTLDVRIAGSGNVTYMGSPIVTKDVKGSGEVNQY